MDMALRPAARFGGRQGWWAGARAVAAPPPPAGDDHALVRRMAAGDEAALGMLYDRWSGAVHSLALRLLADADEAEDVVEETFWQAWRQSGRYAAQRGTVVTWLAVIARSRALDRLRARGRMRIESAAGAPGEAGAPDPDDARSDPSLHAERAELRDRVRTALGRLPAEQRRMLELAYFGGMTQSEIAAHTGDPLGTVKTRTRLGLQRLRSILVV